MVTDILQGLSVVGRPPSPLFIRLLLAAALAFIFTVRPLSALPESVGYFFLGTARKAMPNWLLVENRKGEARIFVALQLAVTSGRAMRDAVLSAGSFDALTRWGAAG